MAQLQDYLARLRLLLHDSNDNYWPQADKISYINQGVAEVAARCKQIRVLQSFSLTAGTDPYVVNYTTLPQGAITLDVLGISYLYGTIRIQLKQRAFSYLTSFFRSWSTFQSYPRAFARYGPASVCIAPAPVQTYSSEWDTAVAAAPLVNLTDADPSPYPYTDPVAWYAAYLAKFNLQMANEAAQFRQVFDLELAKCMQVTMERMIPNPYDEEGDN